MTPSVSCVICCHNSARHLPETMRHLSAQRAAPDIRWEVLIINNASTDNTAEVARAHWTGPASVPLRIVDEPQAGLTHARIRALAEAAGDILSFIDDDNWVCPDWVQKVADFMAVHPEVGALGSYNFPVSDKAFPEWFPQYRHYFAVAGDDVIEGDITETGRMLVGAGFSLRKTAARGLLANGFRFSLSGRSGRAMSSGEDQELCLALQLTGWRLWFTREITLQHFLPEGRLSMRYVRGLLRGIGRSSVMLDPYLFLLEQRRGLAVKTHQAHWLWRALASLKDFVIHRFRGRMIQSERALGRLEMLCRLRGEYHERFAALARAPWLRTRSE